MAKQPQLTFAPYDLAADVEFLTAAHKEAVALTFQTELKQELLEAELAKHRDVRDGAYLDGRLIGICDLERRQTEGSEDCGYVNFFFVAPAFRGKGLGGQLIAHAVDWCESQGLETLRLRAGKDNARAHRCYEKNGFERHPQRDTDNEIAYIKRIAP